MTYRMFAIVLSASLGILAFVAMLPHDYIEIAFTAIWIDAGYCVLWFAAMLLLRWRNADDELYQSPQETTKGLLLLLFVPLIALPVVAAALIWFHRAIS